MVHVVLKERRRIILPRTSCFKIRKRRLKTESVFKVLISTDKIEDDVKNIFNVLRASFVQLKPVQRLKRTAQTPHQQILIN
jgi:hypothetical protein